jgi:hypothetical protein
MDQTPWDVLEPQRTTLRGLVSRVEHELSALGQTSEPRSHEPLHDAWKALVRNLALGPEPVLRSCEACRRSIMATATRCRYCWLKSAPAAAAVEE